MNTNKAIKMIDEYLLEPNSIHPEWVKCLQLCKQALKPHSNIIRAKRKGWGKWCDGCQYVAGYRLDFNDRVYVYEVADVDMYGTIQIKSYTEIDPDTIEVAL